MRRTLVLTVIAMLAAALGATLAAGQGGGSSDRALLGSLNGANELNDQGQKGGGDPNGRGSASAVIDGTRLCFGLTVKNIATPAAAHIHKGTSTQSGAVVVPLKAPRSGDPGSTSGCVTIAADLARDLLANPSGYYWNVHNSAFPAGAVRGRLIAQAPK